MSYPTLLDYWEKLLDLKKNDVDYSLDSFLYVLTEKIWKHMSIKTKYNKLLTLNDKPCRSRATRKFIKIRKYISNIARKRTKKKRILHQQFKTYIQK